MKIECKPLADTLNILKSLSTTTVSIVPSDDGWEFYARDGTNCALAAITMKKGCFSENYEKWDSFAADMDFLQESIAKRPSVDAELEDGYLKITYEKSRRKSRLKILDTTPRIFPKIELKNSVAVTSDNLMGLAKDKGYAAATGADLGLQVDIEDEGLRMSYVTEQESYEDTIDTVMADLPEGPQTAHFSPELLLPLLRVLPPGTPTVVALDSDKPIQITLNTEKYMAALFVAPRIGE